MDQAEPQKQVDCPQCKVGIVDSFWYDNPRMVCDTCAVNWVYHNYDRLKKRTHKDASNSESDGAIDNTGEGDEVAAGP